MGPSLRVLISSDDSGTALQAISAGTPFDSPDEFGWTPMHWAAQFGNAPVIYALTAAGAKMVSISRTGETPLHVACEWGAVTGVAALLALDALVDSIDLNGDTPLMKACRLGHWRCVRLLLATGADPNQFTKPGGTTPLILASGYGHPECVRLLLHFGANVHTRNGNDRNAWEIAHSHRRHDIRVMLAAEGAHDEASADKRSSTLSSVLR